MYPSNKNGQATYCQIGYNNAYGVRSQFDKLPVDLTAAQKQAIDQAAAQQAAASQACGPDIPGSANSAQLLQDCVTGYIGAANGKTQAQACNGMSGLDLQYCSDGFKLGQDATNPNTPVANTQLSCDFSSSPLSWIICPVVDALVKTISWVDSLINTELSVPTSTVFCSNSGTCNAYYTAWQSFRNIALAFIVIAGLIVVISQALGIEILDAYTVRKALPRLLIAVIAITLSWPLMKFVVELSNNLGYGVKDLIDAPFKKLAPSIDFNFGGGIATFFTGGGLLAGAAVAAVPIWIATGGIAILLAYAGTAALAVLVAVIVLILRQVVIILLMLLAPLAIVAYVLPNTRRLYKMWWEAFSKALLMFPLIVAFIAAGRVFSAIAFHNGGPVNGLIGFASYFAPYFMIPLTFRLAGSAMGGIGNFVNSRAQGGFDNLRKRRAESRQARIKAARTNGLYRQNLKPFEYRLPFDKRRGIPKRQGSLDKILNTIGNNTIDAQDTWRIHAGEKGGPIGRALFGRQARDLRSKIGSQQIEHTANAGKEAKLTYHTGRAIAGQHQYYAESLKAYDREHGLTGTDKSVYGALEQNFAQHDASGKVMTDEAGNVAWRAPKGEKEFHQLAGIYAYGNQGARIAAGELEAKAIELDTFKGAGKDETQRTDTGFLGMMVAAQAGRLENHELQKYYNDMAEHGDPEEARKRLETLQELAKPLRTSQAQNYGLAFTETKKKDGSTYMRAYNVYDDPAGEEAQKSVRRTGSQDIGSGKSEDLIREDGELTAWGESILAASSDYKMETYVDEATGYKKVRPIKGPDGKPVPKSEQDSRNAKAQRAKIQSIEGYAQGDTGVGGAVYKIMEKAEIKYRYGDPDQDQRTAKDQARRSRPQDAPPPDAPPDNPLAP